MQHGTMPSHFGHADWTRPMDGAPAPWMAPQTHPQHLVIEGVVAGEGAANGVYRLATEPLHLGT
jgi:hypothetical protein